MSSSPLFLFSSLVTGTGIVIPLAFLSVGYLIYISLKWGVREKNMPPGPPTVPVLGNMLILPKSFLHFKFTEWAKTYGDIFSLKVMNQTIIVLNTPTAMKEVIEKRSISTSNRPRSIIADMITPNNLNIGTGHYPNETWKVMRKASTHLLSSEGIKSHVNYQSAEAAQLMWDFGHDPENWYKHIQRFTTSFALGIIYGIRAPLLTSPAVVDFMYIHPQFIHALGFGTMPPVDLFPFLAYLPEGLPFMPGGQWKTTVRKIREFHEKMYEDLLQKVEKRLERGERTGAFMEKVVEQATEWGLERRDYKTNLGGVLLEGSDTSSAALQSVVRALVAFPEAQKKAQAEIDCVVGRDRTPTINDFPDLPYISAFMDEVTRHRPVAPLGLPHEMANDETIDGMFYPKDSVLFINAWAIFHDERYYDRPEEFIPERFLEHPLGVKAGVQDDPARRNNMLFGAGRRVCPGISFARAELEIVVPYMIWAYDFLPGLDPVTGNEIPTDLDNSTSGITAIPYPFNCRIIPRSAAHAELVEAEFAKAGEFLSQYELSAEMTQEDKMFNKVYRDSNF